MHKSQKRKPAKTGVFLTNCFEIPGLRALTLHIRSYKQTKQNKTKQNKTKTKTKQNNNKKKARISK
jgi:hypothetical protein